MQRMRVRPCPPFHLEKWGTNHFDGDQDCGTGPGPVTMLLANKPERLLGPIDIYSGEMRCHTLF